MLRLVTAAGMVFYGCAKITGAQFQVLQSEMDRPLRDVSGFWLTWYYFGHFAVYKYFIALSEILSGLLLCWRKTTLLGSVLASTLLINIVVIDLVFGIDFSGTVAAVLLLSASLIIASDYRDTLLELFWMRTSDEDAQWLRSHRAAIASGIVIAGLTFQYWVATYNNRAPTPIDGAWDVNTSTSDRLLTVYFERERAHLCVFVSEEGQHVSHDFEFSTDDLSVAIYEKWLMPSSKLLYRGALQADGSLLLRDDHSGASIRLRRRPAYR